MDLPQLIDKASFQQRCAISTYKRRKKIRHEPQAVLAKRRARVVSGSGSMPAMIPSNTRSWDRSSPSAQSVVLGGDGAPNSGDLFPRRFARSIPADHPGHSSSAGYLNRLRVQPAFGAIVGASA